METYFRYIMAVLTKDCGLLWQRKLKSRWRAIVEAFLSMQEDLDRERKVIMKQWAAD